MMPELLKGKVALITGAATGIGLGIAKSFVAAGAKVILTGHRPYEETTAFLNQHPQVTEFKPLEVTDEQDWENVIDQIVQNYGKLDILVNNAGVAPQPGPIDQETLEDWNRVINVNLTGNFLGIKHAMKVMKDAGGGSIINISSVEGIVAFADNAAYNASKGGTRLLTKAAALDAAKYYKNIRVNSVHPGAIDTKIIPEKLKQGMAQLTPLGHIGQPKDIGHICVYLGSDYAAFTTGAEFVIDGGVTAQ